MKSGICMHQGLDDQQYPYTYLNFQLNDKNMYVLSGRRRRIKVYILQTAEERKKLIISFSQEEYCQKVTLCKKMDFTF